MDFFFNKGEKRKIEKLNLTKKKEIIAMIRERKGNKKKREESKIKEKYVGCI